MTLKTAPRRAKAPRRYQEPITFTEEEDRGIALPHEDPVVITTNIANCRVARVFVDGGSSVNVLHLSAFIEMEIGLDNLDSRTPSLLVFGGGTVEPVGHLYLPLSMGTHPRRPTVMTKFSVVDFPFGYNVILSRPALIELDVKISYRTLTFKFPTSGGTSSVHADQATARQCYTSVLTKKDSRPNTTYAVSASAADTWTHAVPVARQPAEPELLDSRGEFD